MSPECEVKSYHVISPVGVWEVIECDRGLHWVKLDKDQGPEIDMGLEIKIVEDNVKRTEVVKWMTAYFKDIDNLDAVTLPRVCPVVFSKNRFKEKVWREIYENLGVGETATYGEIAKRMNVGMKAVGSSMRTNPVSLVIPCHRVVRVGGDPGHYSGGARDYLKVWLLKHEKHG